MYMLYLKMISVKKVEVGSAKSFGEMNVFVKIFQLSVNYS